MRIATVALIVAAVLTPVLAAHAGKAGKANKGAAAAISKTFKVGADTKIETADNPTAKLADLKVGDKVGIAYKDDGTGTLTADKIHVMTEAAGAGGKKGGKKEGAKGNTDLHAHGVVTAVDATAGTITVDVQAPHHKK
jgi:hypothetical protein